MTTQPNDTSPDTPADTHTRPASGKGMPDREPRHQDGRAGKSESLKDNAVEASLELPSDRDQATDMTAGPGEGPRQPKVEQAGRDAGSPLKDTSKAPEMDSTYKKL